MDDPPNKVGLRAGGFNEIVVVGLRVVGLDVGFEVWNSEGVARTANAARTAANSKWRIFIFIKWLGCGRGELWGGSPGGICKESRCTVRFYDPLLLFCDLSSLALVLIVEHV